MGFFSRLFSRKQEQPAAPAPTPAPGPKVVSHKVAGTSFRQKELLAMGIKNPDYALTKKELLKKWPNGVTVYEYTFAPQKAELVPEPENPEDPKAIKVLIDGVHVGYIKAGSCAHIHRLLRENRIAKIEPRILGGKYKAVYEYVEKDETTIGVRLDITELPEKGKA